MHHNTEKKSKLSVSFTWRAESSSQKKPAPSASKKKIVEYLVGAWKLARRKVIIARDLLKSVFYPEKGMGIVDRERHFDSPDGILINNLGKPPRA